MASRGYPPRYVLDEMELWEAEVALQGAVYGNMHILTALRSIATILANQWGGEFRPTDLMEFPWDADFVDTPPEGESNFDHKALLERSKNLSW